MKRLFLLLIPVVLIYGAYQALTYYDNRFPYGRMRETPAIKPHELPLLKMEAGVVPVTGGEQAYHLAAGTDLSPPFDLNATETITKGREVYQMYCSHCHGPNHDGKGTVGQSFAPLPGDLRSTKVQAMAPGVIFKEISFGIPGGRQPALATTIAAPARWQVTAYVKSLGPRP